MPRDDLAKIELRTRLLRGVFLIEWLRRWSPKHVLVRELKRLEGNRKILVVEILVPQFPQFILGQFRVEQSADALGEACPNGVIGEVETSTSPVSLYRAISEEPCEKAFDASGWH